MWSEICQRKCKERVSDILTPVRQHLVNDSLRDLKVTLGNHPVKNPSLVHSAAKLFRSHNLC